MKRSAFTIVQKIATVAVAIIRILSAFVRVVGNACPDNSDEV